MGHRFTNNSLLIILRSELELVLTENLPEKFTLGGEVFREVKRDVGHQHIDFVWTPYRKSPSRHICGVEYHANKVYQPLIEAVGALDYAQEFDYPADGWDYSPHIFDILFENPTGDHILTRTLEIGKVFKSKENYILQSEKRLIRKEEKSLLVLGAKQLEIQ